MKENHPEILLAVLAGLLLVAVPSHGTSAQSATASSVPVPGSAPPTARSVRPSRPSDPMEDFAGFTYTEDQKEKMRKVHEESQSRLETVAKDPKLDGDQKAALLQGYERLEYRQLYDVLTPEQQAEVRKKIAARREQAKSERQKQAPRPSSQPR